METRRWWPCRSARGSVRLALSPPSGMCHNFMVQSSAPDAMRLSLKGHHLRSSTGPACPVTLGVLMSMRPVCGGRRLTAGTNHTITTNIAHLIKRQHYEGSSSSHFHSDGHKLGVDGAGSCVVRLLRDEHILVAVLLAGAFAIHMPEL
ncbi:hypothetical protein E2C01_017285 [Portunus trituberculatus]|uniref:Uncharacterized protein n=1 Tax=Portunus trituberculatus TaxID=210409 RepID=A0A5B7DT23_PORTR|nr:hypothetical protein [Portunus trituberculatus]